jgi:hypothetical protein
MLRDVFGNIEGIPGIFPELSLAVKARPLPETKIYLGSPKFVLNAVGFSVSATEEQGIAPADVRPNKKADKRVCSTFPVHNSG